MKQEIKNIVKELNEKINQLVNFLQQNEKILADTNYSGVTENVELQKKSMGLSRDYNKLLKELKLLLGKYISLVNTSFSSTNEDSVKENLESLSSLTNDVRNLHEILSDKLNCIIEESKSKSELIKVITPEVSRDRKNIISKSDIKTAIDLVKEDIDKI